MKQSIQWPLRTLSENAYRSSNWQANARRSAGQRAEVRLVVGSQLARRPLKVAGDGGPIDNSFTVTLTRISAGELDDDNLRGALKAVRDEVAAWLGLDDRDARVRFAYAQQLCPRGSWALKIEVEDQHEHGEIAKVVGSNPAVLGAASEGSLRGRPRGGEVPGVGEDARDGRLRGGAASGSRDGRARDRAADRAALPAPPQEQRRLTFLRCYALLPWDQDGGAPVVTEISTLDGEAPPLSIVWRVPEHEVARYQVQHRTLRLLSSGAVIRLERHRWRHDQLGECWVYLAPESANMADQPKDERTDQ